MTQRVIAYIDGFNLYFGLKAAKWKRFYWLNLQRSENILWTLSGKSTILQKMRQQRNDFE